VPTLKPRHQRGEGGENRSGSVPRVDQGHTRAGEVAGVPGDQSQPVGKSSARDQSVVGGRPVRDVERRHPPGGLQVQGQDSPGEARQQSGLEPLAQHAALRRVLAFHAEHPEFGLNHGNDTDVQVFGRPTGDPALDGWLPGRTAQFAHHHRVQEVPHNSAARSAIWAGSISAFRLGDAGPVLQAGP
jgi:hypothetical protein